MDMKKVTLTLVVLGTLLGAGLSFAANASDNFPGLNSTTISIRF